MNASEALRHGFHSGRTRPVSWRFGQLEALSNLLRNNEDRIMEALASDLGKPPQETLAELSVIHAELKHARQHLRRWIKPRRVKTPLMGQPASSRVVPEPLGVVLIISAWNYPFQLLFTPLVTALAAGNCALLKPSEIAAASSALIAELVPQYLDPEAVCVVEGGVPETTELLKQRFDHIVFTGSAQVGRIVMTAAARHLTPVTLELGGKSPCIVDQGADLESAARRIAWGKWLNAGQTCIAPDYVLVPRALQTPLVDRIGTVLEDWYGGQEPRASRAHPGKMSALQSTEYARIVNDRHFERLVGYLAEGRVVIGGETDSASRYIEPTVMTNVGPEAGIMREEIFGPILPVMAVEDFDDALNFAAAREKPLAAYLFTRSAVSERRFVQELSAGNMCINDTMMFMAVPELPFGGVGSSGMGQYRGEGGFNRLSHLKAVMKRYRWPEPDVRFPPYTKRKFQLLKYLS